MDIFQTELPKIYAERLIGLEEIKKQLARLKASRDLDYDSTHTLNEERTKIVTISYHSAYGNSVDERRSTVVSLGDWALWSSHSPDRFWYMKSDTTKFPVDKIPRELIDSLRLSVQPLRSIAIQEENSAKDTLW